MAAGENSGAKPALALPDRASIAVLPFTNMSGDAEQDYFADGITDDIITALSYWRWLFVIARNSTFVYKGRGSGQCLPYQRSTLADLGRIVRLGANLLNQASQ